MSFGAASPTRVSAGPGGGEVRHARPDRRTRAADLSAGSRHQEHAFRQHDGYDAGRTRRAGGLGAGGRTRTMSCLRRVVLADNLRVLAQTSDESVDLIYVDPPFNTGRR